MLHKLYIHKVINYKNDTVSYEILELLWNYFFYYHNGIKKNLKYKIFSFSYPLLKKY